MRTRALDPDKQVIPEVEEIIETPNNKTSTDKTIFGIAEEAESVSRLRELLGETQERIKACEELVNDKSNPVASDAAAQEVETHRKKADRLQTLIDRREASISKE